MSDLTPQYQTEGLMLLTPQPDFPASDLRDENIGFVKYTFDTEPSVDLHAGYLEDHQRSLFAIAVGALEVAEMNPDDSYNEYVAFTQGFAAFELISQIVRLREYSSTLASIRARALLMADFPPEIELAERFYKWPDERPNIYDVIVQTGQTRHKDLKEIRARIIGAQIAFELQRPLIDTAK